MYINSQNQLPLQFFGCGNGIFKWRFGKTIIYGDSRKFIKNENIKRYLNKKNEASKMLNNLNQGNKVLALMKALYGLKQSGRQWFKKLYETLVKLLQDSKQVTTTHAFT